MPRAAAPRPLTLDDLDRAELLALVRRLHVWGVRPRDLWRVRWDVLSARAEAADAAALAKWEAFSELRGVAGRAAVDRRSAAFLIAQRASEKGWEAYQTARRLADRAHAAADRAYAALDATG